MSFARITASFLAVSVTCCVWGFGPGDDDFDLSWNTVDSGGGVSTGLDLELTGTIGQPDAGVVMTGGDLELTGGFWAISGSIDEPNTCPEDLSGDDMVDTLDLLALLGAWGPCSCAEDLSGDGQVDTVDLLALLGAWGMCPE